jgi:hypothetical protein
VQVVEAGSGGKVTIVVSVEGEDAKRLEPGSRPGAWQKRLAAPQRVG